MKYTAKGRAPRVRDIVLHPPAAKRRGQSVPCGVVEVFIHGRSAGPARQLSTPELIQEIQLGLPVSELETLRKNLLLPLEKLATALGISKATLHRRKLSGRLDAGESDRVIRFARLVGQAVQVFASAEYARQWLTAPQMGLGGAIPLEYAATEVGAREVEQLLGRIDFGVYS